MRPRRERQGRSAAGRFVLGVTLTVGILAMLVHVVGGLGALRPALGILSWSSLALPLGLVTVNVLLSAVRWRLVLTAMGFRVPYGRILGVVLATWPLAVVLPSRLGDFARALYIKDVAPVFAGVGSVLAEKAVDFQSLCLLALLGCAMHGMGWLSWVPGILLLIAWLVVALVVWPGDRAKEWPLLRRFPLPVSQLASAFRALQRDRMRLLATVVTSLVAWLNSIAIVHQLLIGVSAPIHFLGIASVWPLSIFVGMLPFTVSGVGTRDAAFLFLLAQAGVTQEEGRVLVATVSYALLANWLPAIVGLPWLLRRRPSLFSQAHDPVGDDRPS